MSLPTLECKGFCCINQESQCGEIIKVSCCDLMDSEVEWKSQKCNMEIYEYSCDLMYEAANQIIFHLSKSPNLKVEFVELANSNLNFSKESEVKFLLKNCKISDSNPPIFILNTSFLI